MSHPHPTTWTLDSLKPENCQGGPAPWKKETREPLLPFDMGCPPLLVGGGVLGSRIFNDEAHLASQEPYRGGWCVCRSSTGLC